MSAKRLFLGATAFVAAAALSLTIARPAEAQLGKVDQKCRDTIAKSFAKTVNSAAKVSASCHKSRDSGKLSQATDCNDLSPAQADSKGKFAKAKTKLQDSIAKSCTDAGASASLADDFISCPEPCATSTGVSNPMTSFAQVGQCLACLAGDVISRRNGVIMGSPGDLSADKDAQKCHGAIAKGYGKHLSTLLKERQTCQKGEDKTGNNDLTTCSTADPKNKIADAETKAAAGVSDACQGVTLADIDSCSNTDINSLNACVLAEDDARGGESFSAGYGLPATICPVALTVTTHAGFGIGGTSVTELSSGWNGIGHGQDLVDRYAYGLGLNCPNSSPPCGSCTITGFTDTGVQSGAFTRCRENTTQICTNPFGIDGVCPGLQECGFYFGPPLPLSASNTPVCVLIRATAQASGSAVVESGDTTLNLDLRAVVYTGLSLTQPCPVCVGDTTPQDGNKDGTCQGGANNGGACDAQGFDATFGNTSMDCVPITTSNISGQGLLIKSSFSTGTSSMPFNTKCDFPLGALDCACAVCSGNSSIACNSDLECSNVGAGTCTSNGGGASRAPNGCTDLTCTDHGNEHGECDAGPDVEYCDGQKRANGKGFISCLSNADCDAVDSACTNNDCGKCALSEPRSCFLNPIVGDGSPDPDAPVVAGVFCVPPTTSTGVNAATGQPGPSRSIAQIGVERVY